LAQFWISSKKRSPPFRWAGPQVIETRRDFCGCRKKGQNQGTVACVLRP